MFQFVFKFLFPSVRTITGREVRCFFLPRLCIIGFAARIPWKIRLEWNEKEDFSSGKSKMGLAAKFWDAINFAGKKCRALRSSVRDGNSIYKRWKQKSAYKKEYDIKGVIGGTRGRFRYNRVWPSADRKVKKIPLPSHCELNRGKRLNLWITVRPLCRRPRVRKGLAACVPPLSCFRQSGAVKRCTPVWALPTRPPCSTYGLWLSLR